MSTIKKVFSELNELLQANKDMLVSDLMPQLTKLMSAKVGGSEVGATNLKDNEGNVIAIYCYYHKKWELLADHEYGLKASSVTGYNSMCKIGVNAWTTQQRITKKATEALLTKLQSGELTLELLPEAKAEIEEQRNAIVFAEKYPKAYDTIEALQTISQQVKDLEIVAMIDDLSDVINAQDKKKHTKKAKAV